MLKSVFIFNWEGFFFILQKYTDLVWLYSLYTAFNLRGSYNGEAALVLKQMTPNISVVKIAIPISMPFGFILLCDMI